VEEWLARFGAVGVPVGPVLSRETVHADEQVRANGLIHDVLQPGLGPMTMLGGVFRVDGEEPGETRPAPALGADTDAVLAEL
jgi:crotonobetainyl-CoA:carnitine CoA-transferase CaiB-like acyl-CoA transferase